MPVLYRGSTLPKGSIDIQQQLQTVTAFTAPPPRSSTSAAHGSKRKTDKNMATERALHYPQIILFKNKLFDSLKRLNFLCCLPILMQKAVTLNTHRRARIF